MAAGTQSGIEELRKLFSSGTAAADGGEGGEEASSGPAIGLV